MRILKKIAVFLPALLIGCKFLFTQYFHQYERANHNRLLLLVMAIVIFYAWVAVGIIRRKQHAGFDILVQSSYYVYIFSVLSLTGYFIVFNQVSAHHWWAQMLDRVHTHDGVNLEPLRFMKARHLFSFDVVGNFIMLLPLGIYLPVLYNSIKNFFSVTLVALLVSVSIECMQLATNVRIADIDDVILNTCGASAGFIIYYIIYRLILKPMKREGQMQAYS